MQPQLEVETRAEQLERQHRLLIRIAEVESQIDQYKTYIKSLKEDKADIEDQLDKVTGILEANQITLGAK